MIFPSVKGNLTKKNKKINQFQDYKVVDEAAYPKMLNNIS